MGHCCNYNLHGIRTFLQYAIRCTQRKMGSLPLLDAAVSWLPSWLQDIIEALMIHYGHQCPESADNINTFLQEYFPDCPQDWSAQNLSGITMLRESVSGTRSGKPESLPCLCLKVSLNEMPLHRLVHFLDMILPQLSPMHTRWDDPRKSLLCCHFFRTRPENNSQYEILKWTLWCVPIPS